jgi:putative holliday junction resolvase
MARVMSLDVGDRRVGVALTDPLGLFARPLTTIVRSDARTDVLAVADLVHVWEATRLIVGLPLLPSGDRGEQACAVESFVAALTPVLDVPIEWWDESFTTIEASDRLRERGMHPDRARQVIDATAAAVILEEWLRERDLAPSRRAPVR